MWVQVARLVAMDCKVCLVMPAERRKGLRFSHDIGFGGLGKGLGEEP